MITSASQISLPLASDTAPLPDTNAAEILADAPTPAPAWIEVKGISLPVMHAALNSLEPAQIAAALQSRFGKNVARFFDNDPVLLDLSRLESAPGLPDWPAVQQQLAAASLQLIGIYGGSSALQATARDIGIAVIDASSVPMPRAGKAREEVPVVEEVVANSVAEVVETIQAEAPAVVVPQQAAAMVIDKPLRSGQRIYARGGDLVVLAMVSAGAEVIADGNIHIYAPLRGRALAGAQGDTNARIFTTSFEAELVSIAGVYRTFESPQQVGKLAQQPVQVSLSSDADGGEAKLQVAALSTR